MGGQPWSVIFAWLCTFMFFAYAWPPPFWVLPTVAVPASATAAAIGIVNTFASIAGMVGSPIVGKMQDAKWTDRSCILFLAGCYVAGGVIVAMLRVPRAASRMPTRKAAESIPSRAGVPARIHRPCEMVL